MHSLEQIERGNSQTVLQQADRLLLSNGAVIVFYDGLHAMDSKGYANLADATAASDAWVGSEIGRHTKVLTSTSARASGRVFH